MKTSTKLILACASLLVSAKVMAQPAVLSHRGFYTQNGQIVTDENSLDALKRAQAADIQYVEFDVHLTADDQIIIHHDTKVNKTLNCQKSTFDELRQFTLPYGNQMPSLEEWLTQAEKHPTMKLAIEIKKHSKKREAQLVEMVMDAVRRHNLQDRVYYISFQLYTCKQVVSLDPTAKVVFNSANVHEKITPDEAKEMGFDGISYRIDVFLNHVEWIARCREIGLKSYFWMVNSKFLVDLGMDLGVDVVTSDYADLIAGYVREHKAR